MDIKGNKQALKPIPKLAEMIRMTARTAQLVMECSIHLIPEEASFHEQIR
ncbi:MAG: hypothetical protein ACFFD2_06020 [Promethearchaeota archaeon]